MGKPKPFFIQGKAKRALRVLQKEAKAAGDMRLFFRCRALLIHGIKHWAKPLIAEVLGVTVQSINLWIRNYTKFGLEGLCDKPIPGPSPRLSINQKARLEEIIDAGPEKYGLDTGVWTSTIVREVVRKEFGVTYDSSHIRRLLNQLGFSIQYPRVHISKADKKCQKAWLKEEYPRIKKKPSEQKESSFLKMKFSSINLAQSVELMPELGKVSY